MGAVVELVGAVAAALAEHQGVGQGGGAGGDMDGGSAGEVEAAELEDPAAGVPGPAGDRVIDDGGPDEHEDEGGQHTAALCGSADGEGDGDAGEHALVDGEHQVGDLCGADGGGAEDVAEADVVHIADVRAGGLGEGQRVAPEEPLEGDDGRGHDGEPDEGER